MLAGVWDNREFTTGIITVDLTHAIGGADLTRQQAVEPGCDNTAG